MSKQKSALSSIQALSIILVILLSAVTFAYLGTSIVDSSQISNLQSSLNSLNSNLTSLQSKVSALPVLSQRPTTRNIRVEWTNSENSGQDRFFSPTITVNQGDTIDITFISNDTDAHTFTLESPYYFQINATVPGAHDFLTNESVFTTNATNNSPGVKVFGTPGNVTATGSFIAKYSGIFEYFCIYHVALGMFGYLIVLPNTFYNSSATSTNSTARAFVNIEAGAGSNPNSFGFNPSAITVTIGINNTVLWTNDDTVPHTVTSDNGTFSSGNLNPGDTFLFTFTEPGTYTYHCSYHSWMRASVIVLSG